MKNMGVLGCLPKTIRKRFFSILLGFLGFFSIEFFGQIDLNYS